VPVPHLTKPSRGRRVPTAGGPSPSGDEREEIKPARGSPATSRSGTASPYGTRSTGGRATKSAKGGRVTEIQVNPKPGPQRTYVCQVDGCEKAFRRGEHLKRHIRSLHTHEKPERCTYPGCGKEFSRKDNMQQHLKIHATDRHAGKRPSDGRSKRHDHSESDENSDSE